MRIALVCLGLLATAAPDPAAPDPAGPGAPLSAAAFEAHVTGRTLAFGTAEGPFGLELYHPGRRVTWTFLQGDCTSGRWYPRGSDICFDYDDGIEGQCWQFHSDPRGLRARFTTDPADLTDYLVTETDLALTCPGFGS